MKTFYDFLIERKFSETHRLKLARAKRGNTQPKEVRDKISQSMKGSSNFQDKTHSKADKVKIGIARGTDDRIKGRKWIARDDNKTFRKYDLPDRSKYKYGRSY
jgi:hypothetical protein